MPSPHPRSRVLRFFASLLNRAEGGRLIAGLLETWNPVTGCLHGCVYCWARRLALTRLRRCRRYRGGFTPRLNPEEFGRRFRRGLVLVSDMGDLWGDWVPGGWIRRVLDYVRRFPRTWFIFLTKNPHRYHDFIDEMPANVVLGATIETNRDRYYDGSLGFRVSGAPPPSSRYEAMRGLEWPLKLVSIEPVLDFDPDVLLDWVEDIDPVIVSIGYDNYGCRLPEPPLAKTMKLVHRLEESRVVLRRSLRPAWSEEREE